MSKKLTVMSDLQSFQCQQMTAEDVRNLFLSMANSIPSASVIGSAENDENTLNYTFSIGAGEDTPPMIVGFSVMKIGGAL